MADRQDMWVIIPQGNGGGGGTTNYNSLQNKPKINGVELVGNKTSADLNIEGTTYTAGEGIDITDDEISVNDTIARKSELPSKTSELANDSGFITSADIPTIPTKTSELTNDSDFTTKAYVDTQLEGKADATEIPTKTSDLTNDSGFITSADVPNTLTKADILNILGYEEQTLAITDDNNVTTTRKILVETPAPTHLIDEDVTLTFDNSSLENINIEVSELETQPSIIRVACTNTAFMGDSVIPPSDWTAELTKTGASFIYNGGEWGYAFAPTLHQMKFLVRTNDGTNITGTFTAHITIDIVE